MKLLNRTGDRGQVAHTAIVDPEHHTVMDAGGAVRSIQAANVDMPVAELEALWSPMHLERLARTYWKYLSRVTLGLIRVRYAEDERSVVLVARPVTLLRFRAPEYRFSRDRGIVRWAIKDGILVARADEGYLEIDVRRVPLERAGYARVRVEVEVANFYPAIATWVARWFYRQTQSRIHVMVTHGFLRSLGKLQLEESAVGRFARDGPDAPPGNGARPGRPVRDELPGPGRGRLPATLRGMPWALAGGVAAVAVLIGVAVAVALRRR
jgi:hypothetical protein